MDSQIHEIDSTTDHVNKNLFDASTPDSNETPTVNATNPDYNAPSTTATHSWETNNPVVDSLNKGKTELKKGQQQVEDIITKTKRLVKQQCKLNIV
jgi:hypothetical protein